MTTIKKALLAQVQDEFAERYGIDPQQVTFEIKVEGVNKELGEQILNDYNGRERLLVGPFFHKSNGEEEKLDYVFNDYGVLWVRRNDLNE